MVKYKYSETVQLQVSGPKSIIPEPITVRGRLGMTWLHFLNSVCGLQMDSDSDYYICTSTYTTTSPKSGWTAHLNDQMKHFIDQYTRKREKYCVRLHTGSEPEPDVNTSTNDSSPVVQSFDNESNETDAPINPPWIPAILRKPTPFVTAPVRKFASIVPITPSQMLQRIKPGTTSVQPTPAIVIPTRGTQVITPIQPVLPQQQQNQSQSNQTYNDSDSSTGTSVNPSLPRSRPVGGVPKKTIQSISELRIGAGTKNGTSNQTTGELSPPRLTRYDETTENLADIANTNSRPMTSASAQRTTGSKSRAIASTSRAAASTSRAAASTSRTTASMSTRRNRPHRIIKPTRRYAEDDFNGIIHVKCEAVELDLEEVSQTDSDTVLDQEPSQEEILRTLGLNEEDDDGDMDDNASMCTAASVEERELRHSGIQIQDIKSVIERKLDRFDDSMLRRIQNEIKKLKRNGTWVRNVKRSPMACYLLSEIFKD